MRITQKRTLLIGLIAGFSVALQINLAQATTVKINIASGYNYASVRDQNGKEIGRIKKSGNYKLIRKTSTTATIKWGKSEGTINLR